MKKKYFILISIILVFTMLFTACGGSGDKTTTTTETPSETPAETPLETGESKVLKLGHIAAPGTAYDNFAHLFKEKVEAESDGRYAIDIYPAGQLGVDRELMESLQIGNIDFTIITASDINQFVPEMAVQDLPYLFFDWDHVEAFLKSETASEFYKLTDDVGMTTLSFMPRGFRHVTSNVEPIYEPDDLRGLKIRVAESEVYLDTFRSLGANAQAMSWGEVFTALQQGTIDAHENTLITIRDYNINEVQKYVSETGHFFAFAALQMNSNLLNKMDEADQNMFRKAGLDAAIELGLEQRSDEEATKQELIEKGMEFNEVNDKKAFQEKVKPVYDKYLETHSGTYMEAIQNLDY